MSRAISVICMPATDVLRPRYVPDISPMGKMRPSHLLPVDENTLLSGVQTKQDRPQALREHRQGDLWQLVYSGENSYPSGH